MDETIRTAAISPLRQRLIDDMNMRRFSRETQRNYMRDVGRFVCGKHEAQNIEHRSAVGLCGASERRPFYQFSASAIRRRCQLGGPRSSYIVLEIRV
jgi:hypothetical protein